jgi:hypothetical protein
MLSQARDILFSRIFQASVVMSLPEKDRINCEGQEERKN